MSKSKSYILLCLHSVDDRFLVEGRLSANVCI